MPSNGSDIAYTTSTEWHTVRPWSLALSVREITSVSVTFVLAPSVSAIALATDPSLASLGLATEESDNEDEQQNHHHHRGKKKGRVVVVDALAKGLSVNVNGSAWQRVLIRVDERADEAVIVIYGLMPGRQYDIDLGLVRGGQNDTVRQQVITEDGERSTTQEITRDQDAPTDLHSTSSPPSSPSSSSSSPSSLEAAAAFHSDSSSHPSDVLTDTSALEHSIPGSIPSPLTLEERHQQLQHTLSLLNQERESLVASLKAARRDSQKADASLRSEIDILKRSSEKHAATEHRAKQKILALQEAVKRAQTSTREMDDTFRVVEAEVPALRQNRDDMEGERETLKDEVDKIEKEREKELEKERKRLESLKAELTGLGNKLDKLNGRKEKLEGTVIVDLEEQLKDVEREIEQVESDSDAYLMVPEPEFGQAYDPDQDPFQVARSPGFLPTTQHTRNASSLNAANRSPPAPIQRPSTLWPPAGSGGSYQPVHNRPPSLHLPPSSSNVQLSPTKSAAAAPTTTTLSRSAAPFEPGRALSQALRIASPTSGSGSGPGPVPIHRPRPAPPPVAGHAKWGSGGSGGGGGSATRNAS